MSNLIELKQQQLRESGAFETIIGLVFIIYCLIGRVIEEPKTGFLEKPQRNHSNAKPAAGTFEQPDESRLMLSIHMLEHV